ncbi:hypothetical protein E4T48_02746 [Aureobasidium sp. EXF-10727]|nr:hypothetical protein E4T48_02746 [Aureobasidium sp. EXF-10727]
MAIIPDVPHVAVDIVVDGRPLPEYLDEDDDDSISPDSTTKYVECVSGSRFGIRIDLTGMESKHLKRGNTVAADYFLDSTWVDGTPHRFPLGRRAVTLHSTARYREAGIWKSRDFMFAELVTTEEGSSSKLRPELKDLGTITIELFYAHTNGGKQGGPSQDTPKIQVGQQEIHEKNLKGQAISYQAKLGDEVMIGNVPSVDSRRLGNAFAVFNFRYRSRRDLQTLYLVPRSPSPVLLEDRLEESLNREELLELLRRQKACFTLWRATARQDERIAIKKELKRERIEDDESDDELTVVSSRPSTRKLKISADASTGIETVDLTDD